MDIPTYNVVSLCSGGGGLDIGLELAIRYYGGKTVTQCYVERELYAASILAQRMEEGHICTAPIWSDVKTFADEVGADLQGKVDILTGGYPCQPFSVAGAQKGTDDPRHLWPDIRRIICTVRPIWCFFENVEGHVGIGFNEVVKDLHELGYAVEAGLFTASEVGATHRRKRLFILAFAVGLADGNKEFGGSRTFSEFGEREKCQSFDRRDIRNNTGSGGNATLGNTKHDGLSTTEKRRSNGEDDGARWSEGRTDTPKQPEGASNVENTTEPGTRHRSQKLGGRTRKENVSQGDRATGAIFSDTTSPDVANPKSINGGLQLSAGQQGKVDPEDSGSSKGGVGLADTTTERQQRGGANRKQEPQPRNGTPLPTRQSLPLFPPPPNDDRGWAEVLNIRPEVKPAIRELDDELAPVLEHRRDALRLLGNGVVPTQAAYAFITLVGRLSVQPIREKKRQR